MLIEVVGCGRIRLEIEQAVNRTDVARRLHHSIRVPERHHIGLP